MNRIMLSAVLALGVAGCETDLDAGGNGDAGGTGAGDPTTSITTGVGTAGDPSASSGGEGGATASSGGSVECPSLEGLPEPQLVYETERSIVALTPTDDELLIATAKYPGPATFARLDKVTGDVVGESQLPEGGDSANEIGVLLEADGAVYAGGYCVNGGTPFTVTPEGTFSPIVDGCPVFPTRSLALVADGIAYDRDNQVRWAPLEGDGESELLAHFPQGANHLKPVIGQVVTDGTDVYVSMSNHQVSPDVRWGEAWWIPLDGGSPQKIAESTHVSIPDDVPRGGLGPIVVDEAYLYFTDISEGTVSRVPKHGGDVEVLWDSALQVHWLTSVGPDLAFIEFEDAEEPTCASVIHLMQTSGGVAPVLGVYPRDGFRGLRPDAASIYFVESAEEGTRVYHLAAGTP